MKTVKFRPLRVIKKTGKVTVASYLQWYKVSCADYNKFNLVIDAEYRSINDDELVYDHEGELLFWHINSPDTIPIFDSRSIVGFDEWQQKVTEFRKNNKYYIELTRSGSTWYHICGCDCNGVPCFTHKSADQISNSYNNYVSIDEFEPLTAGVVKNWYAWFLCQLKNANITS